MTDRTDRALSGHWTTDAANVSSLASHVLSTVALQLPTRLPGADDRLIDRLCDAAQASDAEASLLVLDELRAKGIADQDIAELYLPIAARRLGIGWCEDSVGFAEVTIGVARLQGILRELARANPVTGQDAADSPTVLMVVPMDEFHTLGALVATDALRRSGAAVRVSIGQSRGILLDIVETHQFDVIMISVADSEKLEHVRDLVIDIRHALPVPTPIVIGGAVLEMTEDSRAQTGADHAIDDPKEALKLCGLRTFPPGERPRATRG